MPSTPIWSSFADTPELEDQPWASAFEADYGHYASVADLFRQIGLDEREHKESSEAHMAHARFDTTE